MDSDRDLLLVSFFTFLTVGLWVFFEIVKTVKTTTVSQTVAQIIVPFSTEIDTKLITQLEERTRY